MVEIILNTPEQVREFLLGRGIQDLEDEYFWICPICEKPNRGAYFARETLCAECGKFTHPRLGDCIGAGDIGIVNQINELEDEMREYTEEIEEHESEIDDLECRIGVCEDKIKLLKKFMEANKKQGSDTNGCKPVNQ